MPFSDVLSGLGLGASLIVAIGAQNAFLLRQGLRREHVLPVVVVCACSDVVLYTAGAAGFGALAHATPWLITWVRWVGAAFVVGYGVLAARRALAPRATALRAAESDDAGPVAAGSPGSVAVLSRTASRTVGVALALTWLNPHVYLDTVFLAGSVAATHGDGRWAFVLGASLASIAWFTALGYGARMFGRWLGSPRAWRVLDGVIAAVMVAIGVSLVLQVR
jgi:L-lysine exporter family protein LysE/ArgO